MGIFRTALLSTTIGLLTIGSANAQQTIIQNPTKTNFITLRTLGATCNSNWLTATAGTDDSAAFTAAFAGTLVATHQYVDGEGLTCAVSGPFNVPGNFELRNVYIIQTHTGSTNRTLTVPNASGRTNITLRNVHINRGRTPESSGTTSDDAGFYFDTVTNLNMVDDEVTGDGPGTGINIVASTNVNLLRPYVHDMRWHQANDPGIEQINGIWSQRNTNVKIVSPTVMTLTGEIDNLPYSQWTGVGIPTGVYLPYQTDGIDANGTDGYTLTGGFISTVGEGTDVNGSTNPNRRICIIGTVYQWTGGWAQKWGHDVQDFCSIGNRFYGSGLSGVVVGGGSVVATEPAHGKISGDIVVDAGAPYNYGGGSVSLNQNVDGFTFQDTAGAIADIRTSGSMVVDDQGSPTTRYGFTRTATTTDASVSDSTVTGTTSTAYNNFTSGLDYIDSSGAHQVVGEVDVTGKVVPSDASGTRTALGLGTAATQNTSTSGANVALMNGANTWSGAQTFSAGLTVSNGILQWNRNALTLSNGLNSNIAPGKVFQRISGPTGAFSVGGFTTGSDGNVLILYNSTSQAMTLTNEDASSTAANRIKTLTGADVVLRTGTSAATLIYDGAASRWILISTN